jgi:hypothetical protein
MSLPTSSGFPGLTGDRADALLTLLAEPAAGGLRADDMVWESRKRGDSDLWNVQGAVETAQAVLRKLEDQGLVVRTRGSRNRHIWRIA